MESNNENTAGAGTQENGGASGEKTFTQAEVDAIVANRVSREKAKYADYDSLKEKAGKYDQSQESGKSELQKATEKMEQIQKKLEAYEKADTVRQVREKVAKETNVPAELLTMDTEDDCKKQAEAILKFAKPTNYPGTKSNNGRRSNENGGNSQGDDALREFTRQLFNRGD